MPREGIRGHRQRLRLAVQRVQVRRVGAEVALGGLLAQSQRERVAADLQRYRQDVGSPRVFPVRKLDRDRHAGRVFERRAGR